MIIAYILIKRKDCLETKSDLHLTSIGDLYVYVTSNYSETLLDNRLKHGGDCSFRVPDTEIFTSSGDGPLKDSHRMEFELTTWLVINLN